MSAAPQPVPAIGTPWPGQGGIFAGILRGPAGAPDQFLILAEARPPTLLNWQAGGMWAEEIEADGHVDFTLPDRHDSRLLWCNLQDQFEPRWYWTSEQYSRPNAWVQHFVVGFQTITAKSYEGRARAVRRFNVQSLSHSSGGAQR